MYRKSRIPLTVIFVVFAVLAFAALFRNYIHIYSEEYEIEAMCHAGGGIYKKCAICSKEVCVEKTPPAGHKGVWITREEPTAATFGERELRCSVCKQQMDLIKLSPSETVFPSIYIKGSGEGMTEKNPVTVNFKYNDTIKKTETEGKTAIRLMNYAPDYNIKHSYVLLNFNNSGIDEKPFGEYNNLSELYLFAAKDDYTRSRSIVADTQWIDLVADAHPEYYSFLKVSDELIYKGENILFYLNANNRDYVYAGTFTKRLPYGEFVKNFDDDRVVSVIKQSTIQGNPIFSLAYGEPEKYQQNLDSLKEFLSLSDVTVSDRTDINLLIDYCAYALLTDNYDAYTSLYWISPDGYKWYPLMYDNEYIYGSKPNTTAISSHEYLTDVFGIWKTVYTLYHNKICNTALDFASGRLSINNVKNDFERTVSKLTDDVYEAEAKVYKIQYLSPHSEIEKIVQWYGKRIDFVKDMRTDGGVYFE